MVAEFGRVEARTPAGKSAADRAGDHCRRLLHGWARFVDHLDVAAPDGGQLRRLAAADERGDHVLSHQPRDLHPVSGWIADRFGARLVFCAAIAIFTLGSVLCGLSETLAAARDEPDPAGLRRRDDDAGRPADPRARVSQGPAHEGDELLHAAGHARADHGAAGRRLHHHQFHLALEFLHQRADRDHRHRARAALHPGDPDAAAVAPST